MKIFKTELPARCRGCINILSRTVVSVPPHAVRAYVVSRDIALKQFYPTWRVFTDDLTFGDEDGGLQEEN